MTMLTMIGLVVLSTWCLAGLVVALAFGRAFAAGGGRTGDLRRADLCLLNPRTGNEVAQPVGARRVG